jgi:biotin operon repressor
VTVFDRLFFGDFGMRNFRDRIRLLTGDIRATSPTIFDHGNYRISELALHVREGLRQKGVNVEIHSQFQYSGIRNYRVSGKKISRVLNYKPVISVEESVKDMVEKIRDHGYTDFDNDRYYNLRWMKLLEQVKQTAGGRGRRASA